MLTEWFEPSINARVEQIEIGFENDAEYMQSRKDFRTSYRWLQERVPTRMHEQLMDLEFFMNKAIDRASELAFRAGLADGVKLLSNISRVTQQRTELMSRIAPSMSNEKMVAATRRLAQEAKASYERDWEWHDALKRTTRIDISKLHKTTDRILDLIHDINGVPEEGENGFTRDKWDDDFLFYFDDSIDLDECMRRYAVRLATL